MKKIRYILLLICSAALLVVAGTGCGTVATAINTKDVTETVVTTTGMRIGQSSIDKTPELTFGRHQIQYIKSPTGLNATNATAGDVTKTPPVVISYEINGHSAVFGNASMTSTFATDQAGVGTTLGGGHQPINSGTGLNNPAAPPAASAPPAPAINVQPASATPAN